MQVKKHIAAAMASLMVLVSASTVAADPCGMVPPLWTGQGRAIERVGEQMTYAFFKDGIETFVIRPGFTGKVDNFGMLIPFPSAPEIRKVPDEIFQHIAAAIDPPEVTIDLRPRRKSRSAEGFMIPSSAPMMDAKKGRDKLQYNTVRVLRQEAVGMYEVAVLEAGSPKALGRWMGEHGYKYPKGMDEPVGDYIAMGWPFVAVKTRVGSKPQVTPQPGMRQVNPTLPAGSTFAGKVQAMGFRFRVKKPVIPMRLSAFNGGDTRNIVYFLSDEGSRIKGMDANMVRRQVAGAELAQNLTRLPVRILGGTAADVSAERWKSIEPQRNPTPHNGQAKTLFVSDMLAARRGTLALQIEKKEKKLVNIGESLNLRGAAIDKLNADVLAGARTRALGQALASLEGMTMTVIDGSFPREYIRDNNVSFRDFDMPLAQNSPANYQARWRRGIGSVQGTVIRGSGARRPGGRWWRFW